MGGFLEESLHLLHVGGRYVILALRGDEWATYVNVNVRVTLLSNSVHREL